MTVHTMNAAIRLTLSIAQSLSHRCVTYHLQFLFTPQEEPAASEEADYYKEWEKQEDHVSF